MAEAIIGPLVGKLQELAVSEAKALVAVNDDIRSLRDRLMWMQAFLRLRHADPRRRDTSDELIRVWLKQTRDVAFDAEDAIDEYALKLECRASSHGCSRAPLDVGPASRTEEAWMRIHGGRREADGRVDG